MTAFTYSGTNEANLMKHYYDKFLQKQFNQRTPLFNRIKITTNYVGDAIYRPLEQSIGGGFSTGGIPTASTNKLGQVIISGEKKLYACATIDRNTMKAMKSDEGSFVRATKYPVEIAVKNFQRNLERMITAGDIGGTGNLISGASSNTNVSGSGTSGSPYVISFDKASTYFQSQFFAIEIGDILNVNVNGTVEATNLVVSAMSVTPANGYATGTISVVGTSARLATLSASGPFAATDSLVQQGQVLSSSTAGSDLYGIRGVLAATTGTYHNVSIGYRFQAYQKDASSAPLTEDLMNEVTAMVRLQSGEDVNLILMHEWQLNKLKNQMADLKRYQFDGRQRKEYEGTISFSGFGFEGPNGIIPVITSRFMRNDEVFFLNDDKIELLLRAPFEWFSEDGTVFLRDAAPADTYSARYGSYGHLFVNPHFQGYLYGLAV